MYVHVLQQGALLGEQWVCTGPVDELAETCVEGALACVTVRYSSEGELPRGPGTRAAHPANQLGQPDVK
jgi:hypothetical protein